jgi:predicted dehydrogenase
MGVVGAGAIALRGVLNHLAVEDMHDRVKLAAVCDPAPGRARAAAEKFGVARWYETYHELLEDSAVDAVSLCSPIGLHYQQGVQAIEAGKHVHFNKTMAITVAECDDLIARAATANIRLVASPGMMLHPHNQRIRDAIRKGAIGRPIWAITGVSGVADYHLSEEFRSGDDVLTAVDPTWYFRKPGGGPLYDVIVYCLHNLTGILGPARRVTALSGLALKEREFRGATIRCDMDDSTFMLLDFGDTTYAVVYGAVAGSVVEGFQPTIFGTRGAVVGTALNSESMRQEGDGMPHWIGPHGKMPEAHVYEDVMQLVDWVREGKPSVANPEHARHVIDIFESAYRSAETGKTQDLVTAQKAW